MKKIFSNIKKHKKPIIILACAAIVATAVYSDIFKLGQDTPVSDYIYSSDEKKNNTKILGESLLVDNITLDIENNESTRSTYFANAAFNREKSRDEALETLQVVVDSAESMPDVKNRALGEIMQIASEIELESTVEEMIKAKGFEDCVAIISGDNINVIVKTPGLLTSEVAQITDIVKSETGFNADCIRIVEKV